MVPNFIKTVLSITS